MRERMRIDARAAGVRLSSLARQLFSNHYDPKNPDANHVSRWRATYFGTERNIQKLQRATILAHTSDHLAVAQVALAYVLCHPLHAFAVVGCTTVDKFAQNVAHLPEAG